MPQHRNLIIARVGDSSIHETWLEPAGERDFSLAVSYYGNQPGRWQAEADRWSPAKGPKWGPLADFIDEGWDWVSQFDYVALPDDDISATAADWSAVFRCMRELDLDLAQPSLLYGSYWTHPITAQRPGYRARITNFVEVMTPVLSRWALERLLPTFRMSTSGWGLDSVWPAVLLASGRRIGIIDEVAVGHTRPFGGGGSNGNSGVTDLYQMLDHPPIIDELLLAQLFGVAHPLDATVYELVPRPVAAHV